MATIIRADGTFETLAPTGKNGRLPLQQMQAVVGGPVEQVPIVDEEGYGDREKSAHLIMLVNEEGLVQDTLPPLNWAASRLNGRPVHGDVLHIAGVGARRRRRVARPQAGRWAFYRPAFIPQEQEMSTRRRKSAQPDWMKTPRELEQEAEHRVRRQAKGDAPDLLAFAQEGKLTWRTAEVVLRARASERAREERRVANDAKRAQAEAARVAANEALDAETRARHRAQREQYERDGTLATIDPFRCAGSLISVRRDGLAGLTGYEMLERTQVLTEYAPEWVDVIMDGLPLSDPVVNEAYMRACSRRDAADAVARRDATDAVARQHGMTCEQLVHALAERAVHDDAKP